MEKKTNQSSSPQKDTVSEGKTNMDLKEARNNEGTTMADKNNNQIEIRHQTTVAPTHQKKDNCSENLEGQSAGQPFEPEKEALKGIIPPKEVSGNRKENPEALKDRK